MEKETQNKKITEILKKGFKKKEIKFKRNIPKFRFLEEEFLVHTYSNETQNSISQYLNSRALDNLIIPINYKGELLTCFPVPTLEMLNWLRQNKKDFPHNIFHKKKGSRGYYAMLLPTTNVIR